MNRLSIHCEPTVLEPQKTLHKFSISPGCKREKKSTNQPQKISRSIFFGNYVHEKLRDTKDTPPLHATQEIWPYWDIINRHIEAWLTTIIPLFRGGAGGIGGGTLRFPWYVVDCVCLFFLLIQVNMKTLSKEV